VQEASSLEDPVLRDLTTQLKDLEEAAGHAGSRLEGISRAESARRQEDAAEAAARKERRARRGGH
jgi:hypothetical protein